MFDIFSSNKYEKQICELHVKQLEVLQIHNKIRTDVMEFKHEVMRSQFVNPDFQLTIAKTYSKILTHNSDVRKRIESTIKYLKNYASRL